MTGMIGISRPRNDQDVGSDSAHTLNHSVDVALGMDCDDDTSCFLQLALLEKSQIRSISVVNQVTFSTITSNTEGIVINSDIRYAVLLEQRAYDFPDAPITDHDYMFLAGGWLDGQFGIDCPRRC